MAHYESFLRDKLKQLGYPNAAKAVSDAKQALVQYTSLQPLARPFAYPDGKRKELLCLDGTVPVNYRGTEYNIPTCIWLQDRHPYIPPLCYVVPTATMQIKVGKHVDIAGRIYLPYLTDWKHPLSDLYSLIQVLCLMFAEDPPVFARSAQPLAQPPPQRPVAHQHPAPYPMPGGYNMPYPNPGQPMPGGPRGGMPVPGGGMPVPHRGQMPQVSSTPPYPVSSQPAVVQQSAPNSRGRQPPGRPPPPLRPPATASYPPPGSFPMPGMAQTTPYPTQGTTVGMPPSVGTEAAVAGGLARSEQNSFKISDEMMKASLKSAIEGKIKRRLNEMFAQSQAEMASLKKTETDLMNGKDKLEGMIKQIENEKAEVTKDVNMLRQKNKEIEELVNALEKKSDKLDIDDAVVATTPLYNQILELYAEENSLDDTMYYLGEGLRREKIELDVFLKHVRSLSRKQFMCRALLQKARETAGLSAL